MAPQSQHPYRSLDARAYWRTAVAERNALELANLYRPKFPVTNESVVATAGSCFAQHIGRNLKKRGFNYLDAEPPPPLLPQSEHHRYGYGVFSARYGNVYTARQLLQLFQRALGLFSPKTPSWSSGGRYYDPFRPTIEPNGFSSRDELDALRQSHFSAVRRILEESDVFVFTLGLTECWESRSDGSVFPMCPGTAAGTFDPEEHVFRNFTCSEVVADMQAVIALCRQHSPNMHFLLTVSPVPLTATASGDHVLSASTYSKSALRAACGELCSQYAFVDYFPAYELVASPPMRAMFYSPNLRTVSPRGVAQVMGHFFSSQGGPPAEPAATVDPDPSVDEDDAPCDLEALDPGDEA